MRQPNIIKDTFQFVTIMLILIVLVDSTQFSINLKKEKFSFLNSLINVAGYVKATVNTAKRVW